MNTERVQKYFVNRREVVTIQCRSCGRIQTLSVDSLKQNKHSIRINCPCSEIFAADFEFRQDYRQKSNINGYFRAFSTPKVRARRCIIADQSSGGLLLRVTEEVPLKQDDQIIVSYRPDSSYPQEIEKIIRVRHYAPGQHIGGAFIETNPQRSARTGNPAMH